MEETTEIRERSNNSVLVGVSGRRDAPSRVLSSSAAGEVKYLASLSKTVEEEGYVGKKQSEKVPRFITVWGEGFCEMLITAFSWQLFWKL